MVREGCLATLRRVKAKKMNSKDKSTSPEIYTYLSADAFTVPPSIGTGGSRFGVSRNVSTS